MMRFQKNILWLLPALVLAANTSIAQKKDKKVKPEASTEASQNIGISQGILTDAEFLKFNSFYFGGLKEKTLGNNELAFDFFKSASAVNPLAPDAWYQMSITGYKNAKPVELIQYAAKAAELNPGNKYYLENLAELYERTENYSEALKVYNQLLAAQPQNIDYMFEVANIQLYGNKTADALKTYDKIESEIGVNEQLSAQKIKIYLKLNKVDKAAAEGEKLVKANPTEPKYLLNLGEIYANNGFEDKAIEKYKAALALDPNYAFAHLALADIYSRKKDKLAAYSEIKAAFMDAAFDINGKIRIMADYFDKLKDPEILAQAIELSDIVVKVHPKDAKAYAIKGDILYNQKKFAEAHAAYLNALEIDKKEFSIWQNLIFSSIDQNNYKDVLAESGQALELFPTQTILFYFNGVAHQQLKQHKEAVEAYKNGLALGTDNKDLEAQFYANMGDSYNDLMDYTASNESFDKSLTLKPNQQFVLNNYAYYLSLRKENLEKAAAMSKKSNELEQNQSSFEDTYAWILFQQEKFTEARIWIEKALSHGGENSATIVEHYGDIMIKLGDTAQATQYWQKAKTLGSNSENLNKKINDKKYYE